MTMPKYDSLSNSNGTAPDANPADEVNELLHAVQSQLIPFIGSSTTHLIDPTSLDATTLKGLLHEFTTLPDRAQGKAGLLRMLEQLLKYSVNTWNDGFLHKLYAGTNAPGVAADLILSVLNTAVHVYQVSPALTIIEKETARQFASLFGFNDEFSGGVTFPGGSNSNSTSMIIARNTLYPDTKTKGNCGRRFVVFTSVHAHYSVDKAAIMCGLGSEAVWKIPVDVEGRIVVSDLEEAIIRAKREGYVGI